VRTRGPGWLCGSPPGSAISSLLTAILARRGGLLFASGLLAVLAAFTPTMTFGPARARAARAAPAARPARARPAAAQQPAQVSATVSTDTIGRPLPAGFLGFSFELPAMHVYAGRDPAKLNPLLLSLIRQLNPGQSPLLRIGGESADSSWWPIRGMIPPAGVSYSLTPDWVRVARALADDLNAHLIVGINLEANRPQLAAEEGRALLAGIGRSRLAALEIGNEPDLYGSFPWYFADGHAVTGRPSGFDFADYLNEFSRWRALLPPLPLAGPAFALTGWMAKLPSFLAAEPQVRYVTFHRYPLRACPVPRSSPQYASIPNLLADRSSAGLAQSVAPYVSQAHAHGALFRLDELNSAACRGAPGVSDAFASALWVLDTLFDLAEVGVDGINLHTLPGAAYAPFTFSHQGGRWRGDVRPVYYGMLMFSRAFPPGAQLLQTSAPSGALEVWATRSPSGRLHVVLINKSVKQAAQVRLTLPPGSGPVSTESLLAPSAAARSGESIAGQSYRRNTASARLSGSLRLGSLTASQGIYEVHVPAASAIMLTR
jgi:hypothetical protein